MAGKKTKFKARDNVSVMSPACATSYGESVPSTSANVKIEMSQEKKGSSDQSAGRPTLKKNAGKNLNLKKLTFGATTKISGLQNEPDITVEPDEPLNNGHANRVEKGTKSPKTKSSGTIKSVANKDTSRKQKVMLFGQIPTVLKSPKPVKDVEKGGSFGVKIKSLLKEKSKAKAGQQQQQPHQSDTSAKGPVQNLAVVVYDGNPGATLYVKPGVIPPVSESITSSSGMPSFKDRRRHTSGPSTLNRVYQRHKNSLALMHQRQFSDDLTDSLYVYQKRERFKSLLSGHESGRASSGQYQYMTKDRNKAILQFMKMHACYDVMPVNSKLVVLDTRLSVKHAFGVLAENRLRAAALWNSSKQRITGILTVTDFINILLQHYDSIHLSTENIETEFIFNWRLDLTDMGLLKPLIHISPEQSLYAALSLLFYSKINRLPVIDPSTGNMLHILTMKRILKFLFLHRNNLPTIPFMKQTVGEHEIGTYDNIQSVNEDDKVYAALQKFVKYKISALPVLNSTGACIGIYAKYDVMNLAGQNMIHDLNITIKEALLIQNRHKSQRSVYKCYRGDQLHIVLERIVKLDVHRLIICDPIDDTVLGILSLSDLLGFIVMKHDKITEIKEPADE